ncbi:MAG TPA: hypothetical protein DD417_07905 [Elusimicrobia bacterium]|nr:hypothetical protein [Elusimicrobiota bacterium]
MMPVASFCRRLPPVALSCALLAVLAGPGAASDISARLDAMTKTLVSGYRAKQTAPQSVSLAVLPLNCQERLAKEHVGVAVSELLTHHFVRGGAFVVVERSALNKVLEEQKLQMSGAIDAESAVKVGKLLGAQVLLLGSVEKLGRKYQINARLVDVSGGEILATAYEELPAKLFEEEAGPLLAQIPERQVIGLYLLYNYRRNSNSFPTYQDQSGGPQPLTISPHAFSLNMIGGGIRYFPYRTWMVDMNMAVPAGVKSIASSSDEIADSRRISARTMLLLRGTVNWIHPWFHSLRTLSGAGISYYRIAPDKVSYGSVVVPTIRAGLEYKPQARLGIAFFLNYDFLNKTGSDISIPGGQILKLNRLSLEPALSLYF